MLTLLYVLGVPAALVLGLIGLGRGELGSARAGLKRGGAALISLLLSPGGRKLGVGLLAVLGLASLQAHTDPSLTARLGRDWTPLVRALEADMPAQIQALTPAPALWALAVLYLLGLPVCVGLPLLWWGGAGRRRPAARLALALWANYLLALPFYVFTPVSEPAWSGLSEARAGIELLFDGLTPDLRFASALDNCFPSLHISISFSAWWCARRSGPARLTGWLAAHWIALLWAVPALGVHWVTDALFGLPFGLLCCLAAERALDAYEETGTKLSP